MTQYPAYELSERFLARGLTWEMKPTTEQEQLKSGSVSGSVSDVHNPGEYLSLPTFLCLENKHNSALLHLSEERVESALGSFANRRDSSTENTDELCQEYVFACLLPQQLLCESPLL